MCESAIDSITKRKTINTKVLKQKFCTKSTKSLPLQPRVGGSGWLWRKVSFYEQTLELILEDFTFHQLQLIITIPTRCGRGQHTHVYPAMP